MMNRSPSTSIGLKTPIQIQNGKLRDYSFLHVLGCPVYVKYNSQERTKLDPKSKKCIFSRYVNIVKGFCLWGPIAYNVIISIDVIFAENEL